MFILICRYNRVLAYPGDDVTLSSYLSPETSAVPMEIRWFRENECIYQYKNGQVSVGRGYEGRMSMFTQELAKGNVSLVLKGVRQMDTGVYICQVLTGQNKVEKSIRLCMSGMEPTSPDSPGTMITEKKNLEMEESIQLIELKKLLQVKEKKLEDKTKELEIMSEMLNSNASLLHYKDSDLETMSNLAHEKDERMKTMYSALKMYKSELEMLGKKLQEKNNQIQQLSLTQSTVTGKLNSTDPDIIDTEESVQVLELKKLLQNKTRELDHKTKALDTTTKELGRMASLLQNADTDVQYEREERMRMMFSELELCKRELRRLGQNLQERNNQVQQLTVILQDKEQKLEESLNTANGGSSNMLLYYQHFVSEFLKNSEDMLTKMYQNPKNQLEDIEKWILQKREEKQMMEEQQSIAGLEKEFFNNVTMIKQQIETEHGKMVALAKWMAKLKNEYEHAETDEERRALGVQLKEAYEIYKQREEQIESLTKKIDKQRNGIEERHRQVIQMIREKYETVSKIEAETNILKIILPDVQIYFRNITANLRSFLEKQADSSATESQTSDHTDENVQTETNEATVMEMKEKLDKKEYVTVQVIHQTSKAEPSIKVSQEINNNCDETHMFKEVRAKGVVFVNEDTDSEYESSNLRSWHRTVNGVILEEDEGEQEEQE
ncbi:probable DNA double-strand break repair Rad50 ATPase [Trichomycterus rosablanca]|uniref:probable DNA double-strand break repair Rad50 ATPase n=1 Tax=Trichomycterus rosablanca TaxID=2290929 RepID=UPI002F35D2E1